MLVLGEREGGDLEMKVNKDIEGDCAFRVCGVAEKAEKCERQRKLDELEEELKGLREEQRAEFRRFLRILIPYGLLLVILVSFVQVEWLQMTLIFRVLIFILIAISIKPLLRLNNLQMTSVGMTTEINYIKREMRKEEKEQQKVGDGF